MDQLRLIVGLGNPGAEYGRTRHNAGFMAVEVLAEQWRAAWRLERKFQARLARANHADGSVVLCQPQTYMNLSGEAVERIAAFFRVTPDRMLVIVDDADLEFGTLRLRPSGSSGGHHGLESIERHVGTRAYARLRIGIGRAHAEEREIAGRVLGRFSADENTQLRQILSRTAQQAVCWIENGPATAMNRYNGAVTDLSSEAGSSATA